MLAAVLALSAPYIQGAESVAAPKPALAKTMPQFIVAADISSVQAAEDRGTKFTENGVEKDIFQILKGHGFNNIRLRVFVDPTTSGAKYRAIPLRATATWPTPSPWPNAPRPPVWAC